MTNPYTTVSKRFIDDPNIRIKSFYPSFDDDDLVYIIPINKDKITELSLFDKSTQEIKWTTQIEHYPRKIVNYFRNYITILSLNNPFEGDIEDYMNLDIQERVQYMQNLIYTVQILDATTGEQLYEIGDFKPVSFIENKSVFIIADDNFIYLERSDNIDLFTAKCAKLNLISGETTSFNFECYDRCYIYYIDEEKFLIENINEVNLNQPVNILKVINVKTLAKKQEIHLEHSGFNNISFNKNGSLMLTHTISENEENNFRLYDISNNFELLNEYSIPDKSVVKIGFHPDKDFIFIIILGEILFYDYDFNQIFSIHTKIGESKHVYFSESGKYILFKSALKSHLDYYEPAPKSVSKSISKRVYKNKTVVTRGGKKEKTTESEQEKIAESEQEETRYQNLWQDAIDVGLTDQEYQHGLSRLIPMLTLVGYITKYENGTEEEKQRVKGIVEKKLERLENKPKKEKTEYQKLWQDAIDIGLTDQEYQHGLPRLIQRRKLEEYINTYENGTEEEKQRVKRIVKTKLERLENKPTTLPKKTLISPCGISKEEEISKEEIPKCPIEIGNHSWREVLDAWKCGQYLTIPEYAKDMDGFLWETLYINSNASSTYKQIFIETEFEEETPSQVDIETFLPYMKNTKDAAFTFWNKEHDVKFVIPNYRRTSPLVGESKKSMSEPLNFAHLIDFMTRASEELQKEFWKLVAISIEKELQKMDKDDKLYISTYGHDVNYFNVRIEYNKPKYFDPKKLSISKMTFYGD